MRNRPALESPVRRDNAEAARVIDAVRLANDRGRLQRAATYQLVGAAAVLARAVVLALNSGAFHTTRAKAVDMLDNAGRVIGKELRQRGGAG
jgi:hypothetical protein